MSDKLVIEVDAKTIYDSLSELKTLVSEVIEHQKHTNGDVTENKNRIQKNMDKLAAHDKALWVGLGAFMAVEFITNLIL